MNEAQRSPASKEGPGGTPKDASAVCLSLTVRGGRASAWHALAVLADGTRLEFHSPFDLARFLAQAGRVDAADASHRLPDAGGLR